jgi:hypothetical protein
VRCRRVPGGLQVAAPDAKPCALQEAVEVRLEVFLADDPHGRPDAQEANSLEPVDLLHRGVADGLDRLCRHQAEVVRAEQRLGKVIGMLEFAEGQRLGPRPFHIDARLPLALARIEAGLEARDRIADREEIGKLFRHLIELGGMRQLPDVEPVRFDLICQVHDLGSRILADVQEGHLAHWIAHVDVPGAGVSASKPKAS